MRPLVLLILITGSQLVTCSPLQAAKPTRQRRILCNYDGCSTLFTRKGSQGPVAITADDLRAAVRETRYPGSQVDTVLLCVNAQVMYYPTKVGTMLGSLATPTQIEKLPPNTQQWIKNLNHFVDKGIDPWAVMLDEARRQKLEGLLSFRMAMMECIWKPDFGVSTRSTIASIRTKATRWTTVTRKYGITCFC